MSVTVYRINWFRIIVELQKSGMTFHDIRRETGICAGSISAYKQGTSEPRHSAGEKLLALHRMRCLSPDPPSKIPILA